MAYEFMKEPEWLDLNEKTKDAIINLSFSNEVESDEEWASLPKETQKAVKSLYIDNAKAFDEYMGAPESGGLLERTARAAGRGIVETIGSAGEVIGLADLQPKEIDTDVSILDKIGTGISDWSKQTVKESPYIRRDKGQLEGDVGFIERGFLGGIESIPQTASIWGLAGAGFLAGGPVGAAIGGVTGLVLMFGVGQYGKEYSDIYEELSKNRPNLSENEKREISHRASLGAAGFEVGTELPENILALYTLGGSKVITQPLKATLKGIVRKPLKHWLRGTALTAAGQTTGEMVAGGGQAWVRQKEGLLGPSIATGVTESIIPAITMSLFFGGGAAGLNLSQSRKMMKRLNSDDPAIRQHAVETMSNRIASNTKDEDLANAWRVEAYKNIKDGSKFDFDEKIIDFAQVKMAEDADIEQPTDKEGPSNILSATTVDGAIDSFNKEIENILPSTAKEAAKVLEPLMDPLPFKEAEESAKIFGTTPSLLQDAQQRQDIIDRTYLPAEDEIDRNKLLRSGPTLPSEVASASQSPEAEFPAAPKVAAPSGLPLKKEIDTLANEAATSPQNVTPLPTDKQKESGRYKKGHIPGRLLNLSGMSISIENPKGSERSGTDRQGNKWSIKLKNHYGYFDRTKGKDGDQIDVFIGPDVGSQKAFVVDQVDPETGKFDEHKTLIGFKNKISARKGYLDNYEKGWKGLGAITEMPIKEFKEWVGDGTRKTKPVSDTIKVKEPIKLVTKPEKEFQKKFQKGIETLAKDTLAKVKAYAKWKFGIGDKVKSKKLGKFYEITGKSWDTKNNRPTYMYKGLDESEELGTFIADKAHETLEKVEKLKPVKRDAELEDLDAQIAEEKRKDEEEKSKTKEQLEKAKEELKDLPVKVDAIGYKGSALESGLMQVTFTKGKPDTIHVPDNFVEARKEINKVIKKRNLDLLKERSKKLKEKKAKKIKEELKEYKSKIVDRVEVTNEQGEIETLEGDARVILESVNSEYEKYSKLLECLSS